VTHAVGVDGMRFGRLRPGVYRLTGTVRGGTCTPGHVTVSGGETTYRDVACLLAH
jgi:hypothetical protein